MPTKYTVFRTERIAVRMGVVLPERFLGNSVYGGTQGCGKENPHGSVGLRACLTFLNNPRENHKIIIFEICICDVVLAQTPFAFIPE